MKPSQVLAFAAVLLLPSAGFGQTRAAGSNRPPEWTLGASEEQVDTGGYLVLELRAEDPDGDPIRYTVTKLPPGAAVRWQRQVEQRRDGTEVRVHHPRIEWEPGDGDAGVHEVRVTASDGTTTIEKVVYVTVAEEWETFLMPGLAYSAYQPADATLGTLHGPSAELLIAGWIHRNENRGPSHVRIYANIGLLTSTESDVEKAVQGALGFDLSIERNPRRSFLIPYFGLEGGILSQDSVGAPGYVYPFLGAHLWSSRNLFVNASGGYVFPMRHVEQARGYAGRLSVSFSLW